MDCLHENLIVDYYFQIEKKDINEDLEFDLGEIRCADCRMQFKGTFKVTSITETEIENDGSFS